MASTILIEELPEHHVLCSTHAIEDDLSPAMLDFMAITQNSQVEVEPLVPVVMIPTAQSIPAAQNMQKKKNAPLDVNDLRHSRRLTGLSVGSKNEAAAAKAKEMACCKKNLSSEFEHAICNPEAGPPPELPLETIQAIAVKQCLIPPEEVSGEKLMAPASHD